MRIQTNLNQQISRNIFYGKDLSQHKGNCQKYTPAFKAETIKQEPKYASAIALTAIASVVSIFMFSRGVQKNVSKYLGRFKDYLSAKQEVSSLNQEKKSARFYQLSIRSLNSFIKKSESINNITSLKDILFMKLMYGTKATKAIHDSITNYFEKISRKTVTDSYKITKNKFAQMNRIFDNLDEHILKNSPDEIINYKGINYTKKELIAQAKGHRETAKTVADTFMSEESLKTRYDYINNVTKDLYSTFWDFSFKDFWSKNNKFKRKEMWQTFIAAEQIKGDKTMLAEHVSIARQVLSYSEGDKAERIQDYVKKLGDIMPVSDKEGLNIVERLEWFLKHSEGFSESTDNFKTELEKLKEHKIEGINDKNIAKSQQEYKDLCIRLISEILEDNSAGEIQDMLSIYYKIAPYELSKSGAALAVKRAVKSFDKSVELEIVEFFDKIRDLRLGCAPTDVLTVLISFGLISYGLGYTKDKDERISIALRSGIPTVGALATSIFSATKLVSGGKSIALGILSGIILNRIGYLVDTARKAREKTNP